jgi:hypothetical protein
VIYAGIILDVKLGLGLKILLLVLGINAASLKEPLRIRRLTQELLLEL